MVCCYVPSEIVQIAIIWLIALILPGERRSENDVFRQGCYYNVTLRFNSIIGEWKHLSILGKPQ